MKKVLRMSFILIMCVTYLFTSFLLPIKAQQVTESYSGYWYANLYNDYEYYGGTGMSGYADITIVTTSDNAVGSVSMTFLQPGSSLSLEYSGKVTYYSHVKISGTALISQNPRTGTFTGTAIYTENGTELDATQLQAILDAIDNVDTTDQSILSYLATMKTDIESKLTDIISAVNNIDNLIDTITWIQNGTLYGYSLTRDGDYTFDTISNNQTDIWIKFHVSNYYENRLYRICTGIALSTRTSAGPFDINSITYECFVTNNAGNFAPRSPNIYFNTTGPYLDIYLASNIGITDTNDYYIHIHREQSGLRVTARPQYVIPISYLSSNDIEYWQLLAYFETHEYYENEYPSLDNTNEDLDPVVDDYIQTEDSLINDFDNAMTDNSVNPSTNTHANTSTWGNLYTSSIGFVGFIYNELLNSSLGGNPIYLMVNFSLMLGLALLIIGKRA